MAESYYKIEIKDKNGEKFISNAFSVPDSSSEIESLENSKQDNLTDDQLLAVNSGITADKVSSYDNAIINLNSSKQVWAGIYDNGEINEGDEVYLSTYYFPGQACSVNDEFLFLYHSDNSLGVALAKVSSISNSTATCSVTEVLGNVVYNVPVGGTTGQILAKASSNDGDTEWIDKSDIYTLPIATSSLLGGVMPSTITDSQTEAVGVDSAGALYTKPIPTITVTENDNDTVDIVIS